METYWQSGKRKQYTDEPNHGPSFSSRNEHGVKAKRQWTKVSKKPVWRPSEENQTFRRIATFRVLHNAGLRTKSIHQQFGALWRHKDSSMTYRREGRHDTKENKAPRKPVSRSCANETTSHFNLLQTRHFQWRDTFTYCCITLRQPDAVHPWTTPHIMGWMCYNAGEYPEEEKTWRDSNKLLCAHGRIFRRVNSPNTIHNRGRRRRTSVAHEELCQPEEDHEWTNITQRGKARR
jgi:hypothetical protein